MERRSSRRYLGAGSCSRLGRNGESGAWDGIGLLRGSVRGRDRGSEDNRSPVTEPPSSRELPAREGDKERYAVWRSRAARDTQNTDIRHGRTGSAAYLCGYGTAWRQRTSREFPYNLFESGRRRPLKNLETRDRQC